MKRRYPAATFVHFTELLTTVDESFLKGGLKKILGRGQFKNNVVRNRYNRLLKKTYSGTDPVFDIAYYESISSVTGKVSAGRGLDGKMYRSLSKDNSSDGGHLNESGKRWVAENLLVFLASLDGQ